MRTEIEAWFSRRGVPQLIDEYATERRTDARAGPFVVAWLVGGTILWWGTRPDWPPLLNLIAVVATLLTIALGLSLLRKLRGHVMWWVDRRLEVVDTFALFVLVGVPSAIIEASWLVGVIDGRNALVGVGLVFATIGLGLGVIGWWSIKRLWRELAQIAGLLGRTLPTLLILVLFLLFAGELWEAAQQLSAAELAAVVALLVTVATILVVSAFRSELSAIVDAPADEMRMLARGTPAELLAETGTAPAPCLGPLRRLNLLLLVLIGQLIQSAFVALVATGFLVVVGIIALPAGLQEKWIGESVRTLVEFEALGETRVLSRELLMVAALLGSVVGLYFTGLAITDSAYRPAHFDRLMQEVRQLVAARGFYAAALPAEHDSA